MTARTTPLWARVRSGRRELSSQIAAGFRTRPRYFFSLRASFQRPFRLIVFALNRPILNGLVSRQVAKTPRRAKYSATLFHIHANVYHFAYGTVCSVCRRKARDCSCIDSSMTIQESKFSWFIRAARSGATKTRARGRFRKGSLMIRKTRSKAVKGDFDPAALNSNTFVIEWPPKSRRMQEFPEVDRAEWFAPKVARQKILADQPALIDELLELLK